MGVVFELPNEVKEGKVRNWKDKIIAAVRPALKEQLVSYGNFYEIIELTIEDDILSEFLRDQMYEKIDEIFPKLRDLFLELPNEVKNEKVGDWREQILAAVRPAMKQELPNFGSSCKTLVHMLENAVLKALTKGNQD